MSAQKQRGRSNKNGQKQTFASHKFDIEIESAENFFSKAERLHVHQNVNANKLYVHQRGVLTSSMQTAAATAKKSALQEA